MIELKWFIPNETCFRKYPNFIKQPRYLVYIKGGNYCIVWDNGDYQTSSSDYDETFESWKQLIVERNELGHFEDYV